MLAYRVSAEGQVTKIATFERAGVPTLARLQDGRLIAAHQHFPKDNDAGFDKVAVRFSTDEGRTWTAPEVIRLEGLPDGMRFPFDPTLVPLPDGRVRLYFTSVRGRRPDEGIPAIYSAISADGRNYTFEPGMRFGVEGRMVIDCAVVLHQGTFHLFVPDNGPQPRPGRRAEEDGIRTRDGAGYHATSKDGLQFTRVEDVHVEGRRRWLGCAQSDDKVITFFGTADPGGPGEPRDPGRPGGAGRPGASGGPSDPRGPGRPGDQRGPHGPGDARGPGGPSDADGRTEAPERGGLWTATSADGQAWKLDKVWLIPGADPGVAVGREGGWIVVATGPPRPGTPSDRRGQPASRGAAK